MPVCVPTVTICVVATPLPVFRLVLRVFELTFHVERKRSGLFSFEKQPVEGA